MLKSKQLIYGVNYEEKTKKYNIIYNNNFNDNFCVRNYYQK